MKFQAFAIPALVLGIALSASADETWTIQGEQVVYEADLENGMAVLSHREGRIFVQDLAGEYSGRGSYDGIWISYDDYDNCDVAIVDPMNGDTTTNWGRVKLVFIDPDFPGRWVALGSECFETPDDDPIIALPEGVE